jgi:hypothetical protein
VDSKTKAAAAVSVLSLCGQTALQLSDYHSPAIALALLFLMIVPFCYALWHGTSMWRERRDKVTLKLE